MDQRRDVSTYTLKIIFVTIETVPEHEILTSVVHEEWGGGRVKAN